MRVRHHIHTYMNILWYKPRREKSSSQCDCERGQAKRHFWIIQMSGYASLSVVNNLRESMLIQRSYMYACVHARMFIHACIRACVCVCVCTYMQKSGQHTKKVHGCVQNETNRIGQAPYSWPWAPSFALTNPTQPLLLLGTPGTCRYGTLVV